MKKTKNFPVVLNRQMVYNMDYQNTIRIESRSTIELKSEMTAHNEGASANCISYTSRNRP